ncbi:MAG: tRNA (adenosine(37)-N6)-dimethylallyltransferase MiaA [Bacteroidales bacterium]|nr:tRNA (adenosine(37)-N6)-dimethylallyltransferase MiaA [Bacteroidales bacterium]
MISPIHTLLKNKLIVILGPTAIGKTSLSISLATKYNAEIISCDSRQFYKELKIGVAVPSEEELSEVRHHFIGHLSVTDYYNVSKFENDVLDFLDKYFKKNRVAVMTGGSGLYIDAVCKGIDELPDPDPGLRESLQNRLAEEGMDFLKHELQKLDPEYFKIVDQDNPNRMLRAIEVSLMTGEPYSGQLGKADNLRDFDIIKIGLNRPREELYSLIEQRVDRMMEEGLLDEVKQLVGSKNENALKTVGYAELFAYLDGQYSLDEAITKIKTNTRRYAKRQLTWFKRDPEISWFLPEDLGEIIAFLEE